MMATGERKKSVALLKRSMSDIIQCAMCIGIPKDPRSLPCLHTYCLQCLQMFYKRSIENRVFKKNQIKCPECQQLSDLPKGGINDLPIDFRVKQIEEIFDNVLNQVEDDDDEDDISTPKQNNYVQGNPVYQSIGDVTYDSTYGVLPTLKRPQNRTEQQAVQSSANRPKPPGDRRRTSSNTEDTSLAEKTFIVHSLIEMDPVEAKKYLKELSRDERREVVSKLIDGQTALSVCYRHRAYDLMVYLTEHCDADPNQIIIAYAGHKRQVESCLLIQAVSAKDMTAAQVLIGHGANVNLADGEGITPLFVACLEGSLTMVEYLIDVGADVNYKSNKYGAAPIMAASLKGHIPVLKHLVEKGAEVNTAQKDGYTPLMAACYKANEPALVAAFLLTFWADMNAQDQNGWTPVMYAAKRRSLDTLALLLMNGARVNIRDNNRQTALHHAVTTSALDVVKVLIKHGADPYKKDRADQTCLDLAKGNSSMLSALKKYKKVKKRK